MENHLNVFEYNYFVGGEKYIFQFLGFDCHFLSRIELYAFFFLLPFLLSLRIVLYFCIIHLYQVELELRQKLELDGKIHIFSWKILQSSSLFEKIDS